jgi:hypothetical protein
MSTAPSTFLPSAQGVRDDIISIIRRGLIGSESQHVGSAALAISGWAKLVRNGTVPELPRSLVEQLIATVETWREIGLSAMLDAARTLLKDNFLLDKDLKRLMQTISMIRSEFIGASGTFRFFGSFLLLRFRRKKISS